MKYLMGFRPQGWSTSKHFKVKSIHPTREAAVRAKERAIKNFPRHTGAQMPRYKVISERTLVALENELKRNQTARRSRIAKENGAKRKAENAAYEKKYGKKPTQNFVLCRSCGAKSKVLYSEMGGLQTRVCRNGHRFEYDKWIADRSFWAALDLTPDRSGPKLTPQRLKMIAEAPYR